MMLREFKTSEKDRLRNREYYWKHRERRLRQHKEYYETHKVEILTQQSEQKKEYNTRPEVKEAMINKTHIHIKKYPEKWKARYTARNAVALGKLIKGPCEVCGSTKVESHHDDYSKPFDVRWFCHQHHCELEGRWARS